MLGCVFSCRAHEGSASFITPLISSTDMTHASVDVLWACVIAETLLTSSSVASVNARGAMRMSDPLPLSRSPEPPLPVCKARAVVPP